MQRLRPAENKPIFTEKIMLKNNVILSRYELLENEQVVGIVEYVSANNIFTLTHTEVLPGQDGKGIGSKLAKQVLDDLRGHGRRIVPACSFIANYIGKHPEYADLVAS